MINIYHALAYGSLLKHSLEDVESQMLKDKEEEHTAQQLLLTQASWTLARFYGYNNLIELVTTRAPISYVIHKLS